jgi:hypothetical protein
MNRLTEAPGPPDEAGSPGNQIRCEPDPCRGAPRRLGRARPGHIRRDVNRQSRQGVLVQPVRPSRSMTGPPS